MSGVCRRKNKISRPAKPMAAAKPNVAKSTTPQKNAKFPRQRGNFPRVQWCPEAFIVRPLADSQARGAGRNLCFSRLFPDANKTHVSRRGEAHGQARKLPAAQPGRMLSKHMVFDNINGKII
jgi:hypothetical protein